MENEETTKLYHIWNSLMKMMQDRNYLVPDELISRSQFNFKQILNEHQKRAALNLELIKQDDETSKILLFFDDSSKVTVPIISKIAQKMHAEGIQRCILIGKNSITQSARQAIEEIRVHFVIEFFDEKELVSGLGEGMRDQHVFILSEVEKTEFLRRFQIKETQVPKIDVNEPISRYYGLMKGEIMKIIKSTEGSGKFVTYRVGLEGYSNIR